LKKPIIVSASSASSAVLKQVLKKIVGLRAFRVVVVYQKTVNPSCKKQKGTTRSKRMVPLKSLRGSGVGGFFLGGLFFRILLRFLTFGRHIADGRRIIWRHGGDLLCDGIHTIVQVIHIHWRRLGWIGLELGPVGFEFGHDLLEVFEGLHGHGNVLLNKDSDHWATHGPHNSQEKIELL